jgi:hypothetical protein
MFPAQTRLASVSGLLWGKDRRRDTVDRAELGWRDLDENSVRSSMFREQVGEIARTPLGVQCARFAEHISLLKE